MRGSLNGWSGLHVLVKSVPDVESGVSSRCLANLPESIDLMIISVTCTTTLAEVISRSFRRVVDDCLAKLSSTLQIPFGWHSVV
jgi:hypothetical protein